MAWRISVGFAVTAASLVLGGATGVARADDAYVCGPDKIVYVAVEDLEAKKRSDPCIAAYYGLTVDTVIKTAAEATPQAAASAPTTILAELKTLTASDVPERVRASREQHALLVAPHAAPGTDYRNIRVLNASSPDSMWFLHSK